jgi:plastocyanin
MSERNQPIRAGLTLRLGLIGFLAVVLSACGLGETAAGDVKSGPPAAGVEAVELVMHDSTFDPPNLTVPADTPVTLKVINDGQENHNFTIESLNVSSGPMKTGDVMTVTFTAPAGTTEFVCTWHDGMVGQLTAE